MQNAVSGISRYPAVHLHLWGNFCVKIVKNPKKVFTPHENCDIIKNSSIRMVVHRKEGFVKMAQNSRRRTYRVRYDRIAFVVILLIVLIWILSSCISSCGKKDDKKDQNSVVDQMSSTDPVSGSSDSMITLTPTEPPITYAEVTLDEADVHRGDLILVNAANPCKFNDAAIKEGTSADMEFVTIKSVLDTREHKPYTAKDWEVGFDKTAAYAMDQWLADFNAVSGNNDIRMINGYRIDSEDPDFRSGRTCKLGIFPDAGSSYYYKAEGEFVWVAENAKNYGFILRYPEGKEGKFDGNITSNTTATFRYVGVAAATYIAENNLCLEEYLETVKGFTIDNMLKITNGASTYGVYYVPANANVPTTFSVPSNESSYEISGNNMDGFVVTVMLNGSVSAETTTAPTETTAPVVE